MLRHIYQNSIKNYKCQEQMSWAHVDSWCSNRLLNRLQRDL